MIIVQQDRMLCVCVCVCVCVCACVTCVLSGCPLRSQRTEGRGLPAATQLHCSSELISTSESLITCSHSGWAASLEKKDDEE